MDTPVWAEHDAVILSLKGPSPTYEVYVRGVLFALAHRLSDAKAKVEEEYGSVAWRQRRLDPIEVDTHAWGVTDEFTESRVVWVVDSLP
jgi:hypothetical protein